MKAILRKILGYPIKTISREQALRIAKAECERRDWKWIEPVRIDERLKCIIVWTNVSSMGGNATLKLDAFDGRIIFAGVTPR